ncbi:3-dehydroquinate synthase [Alkalilimnicola ehrlichii MLHE-1]|uniref:3-dehydroquinate synthase n=1 Tax=Alkalilimnicola ehrlichii (strain ATCC BAA-1101 / DSM 17681 / MLHE-1) TaxID=187272 RepID=Q0A4Y5_ALKEH|nr:3-dehydroquinate synthase [Alkalilimnicola ehrlichii]ABI58102.1 3-dehydroquinate synthase [Alkalilimnicola ehrlichii MLHE-1]
MTETTTLQVDLGSRSYPIHIGTGLLDQPRLITDHLPARRVMVVTNETVAPHYLDRVLASLDGREAHSVVLPDGERFKSLETAMRVYDALIEHRFDRGSAIVALGGGVIGDLAGFVAATWQRGVRYLQVPTTLLAQVDSSVGGKTAVNHPGGKNMIGAFHQPRCVIADMDTLDTLPDRELRAGLAEVIKYGLIRDADFLTWLEANMPALLARDKAALAEAVERSCRHKAAVVAEDELEAGQRALLNLGHTFGHAIETHTGYGAWLHGEAVAAGMVMAGWMSMRQGWLSEADFHRLEAILSTAGLPVAPPAMESERFRELMAVDKKVQDGRLRLVLLRALGDAVVTDAFDPAALEATLDHYCASPE